MVIFFMCLLDLDRFFYEKNGFSNLWDGLFYVLDGFFYEKDGISNLWDGLSYVLNGFFYEKDRF